MPFPTNINANEPFAPSAERENAVNRLLNEVQTMPQILSGQPVPGAKKGNQYVRIYNGIAQPIPAFTPVKIGKLMKAPVKGDCGDFLTDRYVFEYDRPTSEDDIIAVVTDKIENKGLGLALVYGVIPLSCKVNNKDDTFLKLVKGEGSQLPSLETSSNGFAPLLWCDTNIGADKFCIASLGLGKCKGSAYFSVSYLVKDEAYQIPEAGGYKVWLYKGNIHNVLENPTSGGEHAIYYMLIPYWMATVPLPAGSAGWRLRVDLYKDIPDQEGFTGDDGKLIMRRTCVLADYWMYNGGLMPPPQP